MRNEEPYEDLGFAENLDKDWLSENQTVVIGKICVPKSCSSLKKVISNKYDMPIKKRISINSNWKISNIHGKQTS